MKKVAIIGHFGFGKEFLDGQTIKTKILYDLIKEKTDYNITTVDTYRVKKSPLSVFFKTIKSAIQCDNVILLVSVRGMKVFFPLLYFCNKLFKTKIHHDVIGGNLAKQVQINKNWVKYLNSFQDNWVEFESMRQELEDLGIKNASVIPNFKSFPGNSIEKTVPGKEPLQFCTFSRVCKEKGIEDAVETIKKINKEFNTTVATLDIYGQIEQDYIQDFEKLKETFDDNIRYGGKIPYEKSREVVSKYFALLFPTHYAVEGFPGTIIDAFFSGVPTIAPNWPSICDILTDGKTGIMYDAKNEEGLYESIIWAKDNFDEVVKMREQCLSEAEKYDPNKIIKQIIEALG